MVPSQIRKTFSLFQKSKPRWDNPEESIGELRGMTKAKVNCWAAEGPAGEAFEKIRMQILEILDVECDRVPNSGWLVNGMFMIGKTRVTAVPSIMFSGGDSESRKAAVAAVRNSKLLDELPPGICLGHWPHPPGLSNIRHTCLDSHKDQEIQSDSSVHDDISISVHKTYSLIKGQALQLEPQDFSTELGSGRSATIGSIVQIPGRRFYLAPAHFYYPEESSPPEIDSDLEDSECDFGVFDDGFEDLSDLQEADFMSQYSLSPESSDLEEDWELDENISISDCGSDYFNSGEQSERLDSDTVAPEDDATYSIPDEPHITSIYRFTSPEAVLPSVNSDNLDYCLIEISESEQCLPDLPVLSQENIGQPRSGSTNVLAATGSGNVLVGVLSSGLSCVRPPKATTYMSVLTVKFEHSFQCGDSGSIVRDADTGMIYGHIVAGDTGSQIAFVVPATHVLNDIMARLSTPQTNSAPDHEACASDTLSETTSDGLEDMYLQAPSRCVSCLMKPATHHIATKACCSLPRVVGDYNESFQESRIFDRSGIVFSPTKGPEKKDQTSPGGSNDTYDVVCGFDSKISASLTVKSPQRERNSDSPDDGLKMKQVSQYPEIRSTQDASFGMASIETDAIEATSTSCNTTLVKRGSSSRESKQGFTIGWVCALNIEDAASMTFLDERQDDPFFETSSSAAGLHSTAQSTKSWFLDDSRFQTWTEGGEDLMWINGKPGLGKSSLSKLLLEGRALDDTSATICQLLQGSERQINIAIAMCSLVQALSCGNEDLFRNHAEKIAQLCGGQLGVDFESFWQIGKFATCDSSSRKLLHIQGALDDFQLPKSDRLLRELERLSKSLEALMDVRAKLKSVEHLSPGRINTYSFGQIGGHDLAIPVLPIGSGRTPSATRLKNVMKIFHKFQKLLFYLMDRTCGGLPSSIHKICFGTMSSTFPIRAEVMYFNILLTRQCRAKNSSLQLLSIIQIQPVRAVCDRFLDFRRFDGTEGSSVLRIEIGRIHDQRHLPGNLCCLVICVAW